MRALGWSWGAFGAPEALNHCSPKADIKAVTVTCLKVSMGVLPATYRSVLTVRLCPLQGYDLLSFIMVLYNPLCTSIPFYPVVVV